MYMFVKSLAVDMIVC